ncbi:MAG: hypothetical protein ACXV4B_08750, partial [Halobacteriota archaeon]
ILALKWPFFYAASVIQASIDEWSVYLRHTFKPLESATTANAGPRRYSARRHLHDYITNANKYL